LILFDSIVARVVKEQKEREGKSDPSSVTIGKCMNILRMVVEKKEYINAFAE
jgi:hypothetical protein